MSAAEKLVNVGPTVDHNTYLGGSDIAAVVGLSPYATALDVWARKTGRATFDGNSRTRAGSHFERPILDLYSAETGAVLTFPGTLIHGVTGATPDAVDELGRTTQVKMVGLRQSGRWGDEVLGADGVPEELLPQVHFEAYHIEKRLGLAANEARVIGQLGTEQRVYTIPLDPEFTLALVEQAERFWRDHVVADRMPVVTEASMDTLRTIYRNPTKDVVRMPDDLVPVVREYLAAKEAAAAADERKDALASKICSRIGDLGGYVLNGVKATWLPQKGKVDWQACARALGATDDMGERYRGQPVRVLRVSAKGE